MNKFEVVTLLSPELSSQNLSKEIELFKGKISSNDGLTAPIIDGILDDDVWANKNIITIEDFVQQEPNLNNNPTKMELCNELSKKWLELQEFIKYVNHELKIISVTYSQSVMQITPDFQNNNQKFRICDLKTSV